MPRHSLLPALGVLATALALALGSAHAGSRPQPPPARHHWPGGVAGLALAGPIAPVQRIGEPNQAPLPHAILTVRDASSGALIAREAADRSGRFRILLPPGTYLLVPLAPNPKAFLPRAEPMTVVVQRGHFTHVVVHYDTGIR